MSETCIVRSLELLRWYVDFQLLGFGAASLGLLYAFRLLGDKAEGWVGWLVGW